MIDPILFATNDWIKQLGNECNKSQAYQEAAKNWEGDVYFIVEPDEQGQEPIYMYMDLYHGQCRQAFVPENCEAFEPEFQVRGRMKIWRAITEKKMDPIKALVTRQLSLRGNMAKIMKNARAAHELVNCTTKVVTEFPLQ